MTDLAPEINTLLKERNASPIQKPHYPSERIDQFLKDSYSINTSIASLLTYLRSIRASYLSTAPPPRHQSRFAQHIRRPSESSPYLSTEDRDVIDQEVKETWRDINAAITRLSEAEKLRQEKEGALSRARRRKKGFGALSAWANGGIEEDLSSQEQEAESKAKFLAAHRDGVVWFLQRGLEECGRAQSKMMEKRISMRDEKHKNVLHEARVGDIQRTAADSSKEATDTDRTMRAKSAIPQYGSYRQEGYQKGAGSELSQEQMQLFAEENRDMLKHYEDRLDQVKTAEKSLIEISELQGTLATNLEMQSAHIDQLVQDSFQTTENVGKGNKELKKASERKSTAKAVFYATVGVCSFFVVWDFVI